MNAFLIIVALVFLIIVAIVRLATGRILFWSIYSVTRRLKIRDKGDTQPYIGPSGKLGSRIHSFCKTRLRIGITAKGDSVRYCWRCEQIIDGFGPDDGPKGKEPVPEESGNVVQLFGT